jgi:hypothetical protein
MRRQVPGGTGDGHSGQEFPAVDLWAGILRA